MAFLISLVLLAFMLPFGFMTEFNRTRGTSMNMDVVLWLKIFDVHNIRVGDVIRYRWDPSAAHERIGPGMFQTEYKCQVAHRVIEIAEDPRGIYFITKGDNNWIADPFKVRPHQITGVAIWIKEHSYFFTVLA